MVMRRLPGGKIIFLPNHSGDHDIDLTQYGDIDTSISQEDVPKIGTWIESNGTSGAVPPQAISQQGLANENEFDLNAREAGAKIGDFTERGNRAATHRQRAVHVIIDTEEKDGEY